MILYLGLGWRNLASIALEMVRAWEDFKNQGFFLSSCVHLLILLYQENVLGFWWEVSSCWGNPETAINAVVSIDAIQWDKQKQSCSQKKQEWEQEKEDEEEEEETSS